MSTTLNVITSKITEIHEHLQNNEKIDDLTYALNYVEKYDSIIRDHYLTILLKHYFHNNDMDNFKKLSSLGYKFDVTMEDIEFAFLNITTIGENVIEVQEESILFFKDTNYKSSLKAIYDYYQNADDKLKNTLDGIINLLKKNNYICAFCHMNKELGFTSLFLDEVQLSFVKKELPFLLK